MAASAAIIARDLGVGLALQILIYPMLDDRTVGRALELLDLADAGQVIVEQGARTDLESADSPEGSVVPDVLYVSHPTKQLDEKA